MGLSEDDLRATKAVRALMAKRGIDVTRCDIRVTHSVCYIRGLVSVMAGVVIPDLQIELENCGKVLRSKPEIRDVVIDCAYRR